MKKNQKRRRVSAMANGSDKIKLGSQGEDLVADWLISTGFTILERNYRKNFGEIDLIAGKDNLVSFIEVKTRQSRYFDLSQVITESKQRKLILTAKHYLLKAGHKNKIYRFDVALVEKVEQKDSDFEIKYIPNAFTENTY